MKKRFGVGLILACLLALGLSPGVMATTECDKGAAGPYVPYEPTVDPSLLNAVLNLLGEIPIDFTYDYPFRIAFAHTLHLNIDSAISVAGVDFLVETDVGSITVTLSLPVWRTNMTATVGHTACRNCDAERTQCYANCGGDYWCRLGCDANYGSCLVDPVRLACEAEKAAINLIVGNGLTAGVGFTSATVEQWADVCVNGACQAIHPLEGTEANVNGFYVNLFPAGILDFLNSIISGIVGLFVPDVIESFFVTDDGQGVLINAFSSDIKNNGCMPDQAVLTCMQAACSVVDQPRHSTAKSLNALFYLLPVGFMVGLILWRRRR